MLELLSLLKPDDPKLAQHLTEHLAAVTQGPRGDTSLIGRVEADVAAAPERHIHFDSTGMATLNAADRSFRAGRFLTPTLGELQDWALDARERAGNPPARLAFWVLDGASPATDIGALQAHAPPGSLFQVASQFNCLEAPDAFVTNVASYLHDPTQGPRASISAFPGTFVRHYAAPNPEGSRFVQHTDGAQLNLLADVSVGARVTNGYLTTDNITDPESFANELTEHRSRVRVGVHDSIEVVFGEGWTGPVPDAPDLHIAQVLTSSVAAGGYSRIAEGDPHLAAILTELQRAAHLGTLLAAAWLGKSYVCLTPIGGGVFGNPHSVIFDGILWALSAAEPYLRRDLTVVLNGYNLGRYVDERRLRREAAARGGGFAFFRMTDVAVFSGG